MANTLVKYTNIGTLYREIEKIVEEHEAKEKKNIYIFKQMLFLEIKT